MDDLDLGRLARDTMRLQRIGTPLADVVREGVRYAAPRAENGWDHSMATLTDCLRMSLLFDESLRALPVIQGLSVAAENQVRRPLRTRPEPADPVAGYGSIPEAIGAYPMLVDAERADDAEALLRGLIAAGVPPAVLRHTLLTAVTDHFLAYGHSMIFVQKAFDLLDQIGWQEADAVLSPLVPEMVLGTRYDKLPYMRKFLRAWQVAEPDLARLARGTGSGPFDSAGYRRALTDGAPEEALSALVRALESGAPVTAVIDATGRAAAERLARFDIDLDLDDTNEWGWLDVTHTLTYLNALRWAWAADPSPQVLRGVFHAAWFVQWTGQFDRRNAGKDLGRPAPHPTTDAGDMHQAIARRDPEAAVALAKGFTGPRAELERALIRAAAEDHSTAPIMVAHVVKTAHAAVSESRSLAGDQGAVEPIAGRRAVPRQPEEGEIRAPVHARCDHNPARRAQARIRPGACLAPVPEPDPEPVLAADPAVRDAAVGEDHLPRGDVVRSAGQQDAIHAEAAALGQSGGEHPGRVALPPPRPDDVVADVAAGLQQVRGQLMPEHESPEVVLAGDVPVDGGRDAPPNAHAAPLLDEAVEVLAGRTEPVGGRAGQQAVGLLADQVGHPDIGRRPDQPGLARKADHRGAAYPFSRCAGVLAGLCPAPRNRHYYATTIQMPERAGCHLTRCYFPGGRR